MRRIVNHQEKDQAAPVGGVARSVQTKEHEADFYRLNRPKPG